MAGAPIRYELTENTTLICAGEHTEGGVRDQLKAAIKSYRDGDHVVMSTTAIADVIRDHIQTRPALYKYKSITLEGRNTAGEMVQVYRDPKKGEHNVQG